MTETKYECLNCCRIETQKTETFKDVVVCPNCCYGAMVESSKCKEYLFQPEQSFGKGNYTTSVQEEGAD